MYAIAFDLTVALAEQLGLQRGCLVAVAHSGSRGLGTALARRYGDATLEGPAIGAYLADVAGACRFAQVNRFLLAYRMLRALGAARVSKVTGSFDVTHNDVREERVAGAPAWIHRKGAAPAHTRSPTIVLGSRGAPSWVLVGLGDETAAIVAHRNLVAAITVAAHQLAFALRARLAVARATLTLTFTKPGFADTTVPVQPGGDPLTVTMSDSLGRISGSLAMTLVGSARYVRKPSELPRPDWPMP